MLHSLTTFSHPILLSVMSQSGRTARCIPVAEEEPQTDCHIFVCRWIQIATLWVNACCFHFGSYRLLFWCVSLYVSYAAWLSCEGGSVALAFITALILHYGNFYLMLSFRTRIRCAVFFILFLFMWDFNFYLI